jgi:hypothetical protein
VLQTLVLLTQALAAALLVPAVLLVQLAQAAARLARVAVLLAQAVFPGHRHLASAKNPPAPHKECQTNYSCRLL